MWKGKAGLTAWLEVKTSGICEMLTEKKVMAVHSWCF